jgi:hypothetical protein
MHRVSDLGLLVGADPVGEGVQSFPQIRPEDLPGRNWHFGVQKNARAIIGLRNATFAQPRFP